MTYLDQAARRAQMQHALTVPYWRDITNLYECERVYRAAGITGWTERDHWHVVDVLMQLRWQTQVARIAA